MQPVKTITDEKKFITTLETLVGVLLLLHMHTLISQKNTYPPTSLCIASLFRKKICLYFITQNEYGAGSPKKIV